MSDRFSYFAYGSNMSTPRLRYRVPGAERIGVARLVKHRLRFHKRSNKDHSGKCDAEYTGDEADEVVGVLFCVPESQRQDLHSAEGRGFGYDDYMVHVVDTDGNAIEALTYRAAESHKDGSLAPLSWYWDFVAEGAREHALPAVYVATFIASVRRIDDTNGARDREERAKVVRGSSRA